MNNLQLTQNVLVNSVNHKEFVYVGRNPNKNSRYYGNYYTILLNVLRVGLFFGGLSYSRSFSFSEVSEF